MASVDERDPQTLLPPALRSGWAVVPQVTLYGLFAAGLLLGAGTALTAAGFATGLDGLRWGFPAGLGAALLLRWVLGPVERRRVAELRAPDPALQMER